MKIDPSDVKLLKIFLAVVDAHGISNAQSVLNKDASTISKALTQLEERLQLRLCERGRQGFNLTAEGREIYDEGVKLFISLRGLEQKVATLSGAGAGWLSVGIIDNIITDENCPLRATLAEFGESRPLVNLQVLQPAELERQLLDKRLDVAISIFEDKSDYIEYLPLYRETDHLYCARQSHLGERLLAGDGDATILELINSQSFVSRKFLNQRELGWLALKSEDQVCHTSNIEAVLFLILSGMRVGFMPEHFARSWVRKGDLLTVLPEQISNQSLIEVAYLKPAGVLRPAIGSFIKSLSSAGS